MKTDFIDGLSVMELQHMLYVAVEVLEIHIAGGGAALFKFAVDGFDFCVFGELGITNTQFAAFGIVIAAAFVPSLMPLVIQKPCIAVFDWFAAHGIFVEGTCIVAADCFWSCIAGIHHGEQRKGIIHTLWIFENVISDQLMVFSAEKCTYPVGHIALLIV